MAYNDSQFQKEDWKAIQSIHESSKKADVSKMGKYGVGFWVCYHVTDQPQILSGPSFALLGGCMKIEYDKFKESDHCKHF
ncbi:hypothetical protein F5887DRAFT_1081416 [Amanita rubescens]|nr:hypothetical protein F5887DRAFT_1081416 [Amanita rubescens]